MPAEVRVRGAKEVELMFRSGKLTLPAFLYNATNGAGRELRDKIRHLTPVKTGRSRASIKTSKTVHLGRTYRVKVYSNRPQVRRLEYGTRPHFIHARPGGYLAYKHRGTLKFRKGVIHPGTRPYRMFALGTAWYRREVTIRLGATIDAWRKANGL